MRGSWSLTTTPIIGGHWPQGLENARCYGAASKRTGCRSASSGIGRSGLTTTARSPFFLHRAAETAPLWGAAWPFPLVVPVLTPPALPNDVLDLPLGDEGVEEGLDHLLVGVGEMLDRLELAGNSRSVTRAAAASSLAPSSGGSQGASAIRLRMRRDGGGG